jgi:heptosyltransferase-2
MTSARSLLRSVNRAAERALLAAGPLRARRACRPIGPLRRVLVVKLVGMGDAVLVRSLVEHLQRTHPRIEIGALAGPSTREVFETIPGVRLHTYDPAGGDFGLSKGAEKLREIRAGAYDAVIDFEQHLLLVAAFLAATGIRTRIGLSSSASPRGRFQTHTVPLPGDEPMWQAYRALVETVAGPLRDASSTPLPVSPLVVADIRQWWTAKGMHEGTRAVALHLGSGSTAVARRWPVSRFVRLADHLSAAGWADTFVLTGRPAEAALAREFARESSQRAVYAMDLRSLQHTADVLRRCALVVSNDTGVMHLAAAMGTPTVGLFGPNSPARYAPVGARTAAVYRANMACSPCIHIHRGEVPECSHPVLGQCLLDIEVAHVLDAARPLMATDTRTRRILRLARVG